MGMNSVANKIYDKIKLLVKEREKLEHQIKDLKRDDDRIKSHMHHTEFEIALETTNKINGPDLLLLHELSELRHDHLMLKKDKNTLAELEQKLKDMRKTIEVYTFWMNQANNGNENIQHEAEKHVFG